MRSSRSILRKPGKPRKTHKCSTLWHWRYTQAKLFESSLQLHEYSYNLTSKLTEHEVEVNMFWNVATNLGSYKLNTSGLKKARKPETWEIHLIQPASFELYRNRHVEAVIAILFCLSGQKSLGTSGVDFVILKPRSESQRPCAVCIWHLRAHR